uniref:Anaphase-promoting complex subunit 4 C-terminal half WD40 domain-containing protein n=1 Tax=Eptatretus burgeri TaxID=7764 RepID=A0A8C4QZ41_EPTBU
MKTSLCPPRSWMKVKSSFYFIYSNESPKKKNSLAVILTLSDETIPPENSKMSQKDIMLVANFIEEHFGPKKNDYEKSGKYFSVERVSQYLKDEDLDMPQDLSQNSWCSFVKNSQPLTESPLLCRCHHKSSLCQMRSLMDAKVRACLHKPAVTVGKSLCTHVQWTLFKHPGRKGNPYCLSMWSNEHAALQMTLFSLGPSPADVIYLMETNTAFTKLDSHGPSAIRSLRPVLSTDKSRVIVLDAQFYDQDTVTMLLRGHFDGEEDQARALTQVSIVPTDGETSPTIPNGTPTASQQSSSFNEQACIISDVNVPLNEISIDDWRTLKNMDACSVAVNGQRSVACVMSNSRQHVRLYEMDAEEEESGELDETADGSDITMDMIPAQLDSNLPHPERFGDILCTILIRRYSPNAVHVTIDSQRCRGQPKWPGGAGRGVGFMVSSAAGVKISGTSGSVDTSIR